MLRPDDLVGLADFELGNLTLSPSRRVVEGGDRSSAVEPRVMQVLVLLAREKGKVVTRQHLFDEIWGGVPVGDDSLNRAVAGARRALELDPDNLNLETIPRTGYQLNVKCDGQLGTLTTRRGMVLGGGAALAVAVGAGGLALWSRNAREDRRFDQLMDQGREALGYYDRSGASVPYFEKAVAIRSKDAEARGLLAYSRALRVEGPQALTDGVLQEAEREASEALTLDPHQADARLAQIVLRRSMQDFATTEDELRAVLASDPRNIRAMRQLWELMQCVGRSQEALALVERALTLAPLSAVNNFPRAQLLWITGETAEADRVIDRAKRYWPRHPFVLFAQFNLLAFTDRVPTARAMLERKETIPGNFSEASVALWRINLDALETRSPASIARAADASVRAAQRNLGLSSQAVMVLSALGELDAAFEIANSLFVSGDNSASSPQVDRPVRKGTAWRFAPWLFTPPVAAMRKDARFLSICDAAGLTDYWSERGIRPDYQLES